MAYLHVIVHILPQNCDTTIPLLNLSNLLLNLQSQDVHNSCTSHLVEGRSPQVSQSHMLETLRLLSSKVASISALTASSSNGWSFAVLFFLVTYFNRSLRVFASTFTCRLQDKQARVQSCSQTHSWGMCWESDREGNKLATNH